jgi:hypothetical protein
VVLAQSAFGFIIVSRHVACFRLTWRWTIEG